MHCATRKRKVVVKRNSEEIRAAFEARGCKVAVTANGTSYRAGGDILIVAPGVDPSFEAGVSIVKADFSAFDGTGYDGRGRRYDCWLVTAGDFVPATPAVWAQAAEDKRFRLGTESRSASNEIFLVHRDEKAKGLGDLAGAFAALGL